MVGDGLNLILVSAHPPSRSSLTEYGFHLAAALRRSAAVTSLTVLSDRLQGGDYPPGVEGVWAPDHAMTFVRLAREVHRRRPDAVVFNLQNATFGRRPVAAGLGLLTPAMCRLLGIPSVVILHNLADLISPDQVGFGGSRWWRRLYRPGSTFLTWMLLRANRLTVTVPRYVEYLQGRYRARNVVHVPHGSFSEPAMLSGRPESVRLLAFGKFGTYKRVDVMLDAAAILEERGVEVEVVVAGTDNPNAPGYLAETADRYRQLERVVFTGYVEEDEVAALFASAWAVVMPYTSTTGASGVLHQAGEFGRPVLMPAIGDFVDLMSEQGFEGVDFTPDDPISLADAIETLIKDPDRWDAIAGANQAAAGSVSMDDVAESLLSHVASVKK